MSVRTPGAFLLFAIRIAFVLLVLVLFFLLARSGLVLITSFAVPFGFSSITTAIFSVATVIFFVSIGILVCMYLFPQDQNGN